MTAGILAALVLSLPGHARADGPLLRPGELRLGAPAGGRVHARHPELHRLPDLCDLAHLFTYLPFGDAAYRVNLASAVFAAAAVAAPLVLAAALVSVPAAFAEADRSGDYRGR